MVSLRQTSTSRLLAAAPAGRLRLLVTSRVAVPLDAGAGSFALDPLSPTEAGALVSALAPGVSDEDAVAIAARCGCVPVKICALANAINLSAISASDIVASSTGGEAVPASGSSHGDLLGGMNVDVLSVALNAAPSDIRAALESLTAFPTSFDEESAAEVMLGVLGGDAMVSSSSRCKELLRAAVTAGLLNHDPRSDVYKMHLLVREAVLSGGGLGGKPPLAARRAFLIRTARRLEMAGDMFKTKDQSMAALALFDAEWASFDVLLKDLTDEELLLELC